MACIQERPNENGDVSYRVSIRKKGHIISKSFYTKEDAEIYAFYKERLIDLMENFEVPIEKRLTLQSIMNIRPQENTWGHKSSSIAEIDSFFGKDILYQDISYERWIDYAKHLSKSFVYRGAKTESAKRIMSPLTLRRKFAEISSEVSYAKSQGLEVINHPLQVMQNFINPMCKKEKSD